MYDASNKKDIRRAEKEAARRLKTKAEFITAAMTTQQGRAWFHDFLSDRGIFSTTFVAGDALSSAFAEGNRNSGIQIYADIVTLAPDNFILMMREAQIKDITNERRASTDHDDSRGNSVDDEPEFDYTTDHNSSPRELN